MELSSDDGSAGDVELSDDEDAFNGFSEDEGMEDGELSLEWWHLTVEQGTV